MIILPDADELTQPYWDAAAVGELRIQHCGECDYWWHPPALICPRCQSRNVAWDRVSGHGRVHAWTLATHPFHPAVTGEVPYIIGLIDLDEGPRLVTNIRNCPPESVTVGMRVSVTFEARAEGIVLPQFEPAGDRAAA